MTLPNGWSKGTPAVDLCSFVHTSGWEVTENLRGWRCFAPNGRPLRGTYDTVRKAIAAAEDAMRMGTSP